MLILKNIFTFRKPSKTWSPLECLLSYPFFDIKSNYTRFSNRVSTFVMSPDWKVRDSMQERFMEELCINLMLDKYIVTLMH